MKIAYIGGRGLPSKSGMERVIEAVTTRLSSQHEICVYCDSTYTLPDTKMDGIRLIRIRTIKGKYTRSTFLYLFSAFHALLKGDYDLIHVHGIETCFILPILRLKYRVIVTSHGIPSRTPLKKWGTVGRFIMSLMEYPFLFLSNDPTSVSSVDASYLASKYKKKVTYIPNGVIDTPKIDKDAAILELSKYGISLNTYLLFVAQRIDPLKGCHLILQAIPNLSINIPLVIIGDLWQVPEYGRTLKQIAKNSQVLFLPQIDNKDLLFGIVKLCKLFIFPSFREGMSMMLLEAASLAVPIICSDIPENKAVMQENTLYFCSGNAKDLAAKMTWAVDHLEEMNQLAFRAKESLKEKFSWDRISQEYERRYERLYFQMRS
jgi:glycosyltransferase involved in cell wall biosynthesis